jgi:hypothetical protein
MSTRGLRECLAVVCGAVVLTAVLLYPFVFHMGSLGRVNLDDGRFSIWNVAWVARALVVDPLHVYNANIFFPQRRTLAYSENNLGAGVLAMPAYWATRNPYLALNTAMLAGFVLAAAGMYYLVRYLTRDRRAAVVSAICFAFCPFVLVHTAHIQLLMTAWMPFSMLAFHRLADRPTPGRGAALGVAMATQAVFCGYYGIFVVLMVGFAVLVSACARGCWSNVRYWSALAIGAAVSLAIVLPLFAPYAALQRTGHLNRPLEEAVRWSANWPAYLASGAYAHGWMLGMLEGWHQHWNEAIFPGFVATVGGLCGAWIAARDRRRELLVLYGGLVVLAAWASFGPDAGLYAVLYRVVPVFSLLHAPARFGLIVVFGLCVLTGMALQALLPRVQQATLVASVVALAAACELAVGIDFRPAPPVSPAYQFLATLPRAALIEMPFFEQRLFYPRHTVYMLASTMHWMNLVNGYSDSYPDDFVEKAVTLAPFPFPGAFRLLRRDGVRYAMFHLDVYDAPTRAEVEGRLVQFAAYLRPLYIGTDERLYEIVGSP